MFKGEIYDRIWKAIRAKMIEAQKEFDDGVIELEMELEDKKEKLGSDIVNKFLGKIL